MKRCTHCGADYTWQSSGYGCGNNYNHADWCPGCTEAVYNALAAIPRKFEARFRDINEVKDRYPYTLKQLLAWEKDEQENLATGIFGLKMQRVFMGLIDVNTGDSQNSRLIRDPLKGTAYRVTTWRKKSDYTIEVEQEWDVQAQKWTGHQWPF